MDNRQRIVLEELELIKQKIALSGFEINEEGDLCLNKDQSQKGLCNFVPKLTQIVYTLENNTIVKTKYRFEGILKGQEKLQSIEVTDEELHNKKWIKKWSPFCRIYTKEQENFDSILELIYFLSKQTNTSIEVNSIGWNLNGDNWSYLVTGKSYTFTQQSSPVLKTTVKDFSLLSNPNINEEIAFKRTIEMLKLCDPKLSYSLFSFLLTSLLTTPLTYKKELSPNFSLWVYGKSGTGKTNIAELFSKIYDKQNMIRVDALRKKLKDTSRAFKDCVLILDDFGTAKNRNDESNTLSKIENLIRGLGDKSNSADSESVPQGMLLFTGERFIEMNESNYSTVARLIRVKMDNIFNPNEDGYTPEKVDKFNEYKKGIYLPTSINYYLKWLSDKININLLDEYYQDFIKLRKEIKIKIHARCIDSIAHMIIALNFYLTYGKESGFITPEEYIDQCNKSKEIFLMVLEDQKKSVPDPQIEQFLDVLKKLLQEGKIKVAVKGNLSTPGKLNNDKKIYGVLDLEKNSLKLQWSVILEKVDDFIRNKDNVIPAISQQSKIFGKNLAGHRYIRLKTYDTSNNVTTPSITIENGKDIKCRVIDFYADKIPDIIQLIKELNPDPFIDDLLEANQIDYDREETYRSKKKKKGKFTFLSDGKENTFKK
jgi:hypothetical protein